MDITGAAGLIAAAGTIGGVVLGWMGHSRTGRKEERQEERQVATKDAVLRSDMEYIKRGVDDIRLEQRVQVQRIDALAERVTRVEESAKQAHHRMNRLDGQKED